MELSNRFYFREGSFKLINDDTFNALKNFEEKTFEKAHEYYGGAHKIWKIM